jgi:hypothetical protein
MMILPAETPDVEAETPAHGALIRAWFVLEVAISVTGVIATIQ